MRFSTGEIIGIALLAACALGGVLMGMFYFLVGICHLSEDAAVGVLGLVPFVIPVVIFMAIGFRALARELYRLTRTRLSTWKQRQKRKPEGGPYR